MLLRSPFQVCSSACHGVVFVMFGCGLLLCNVLTIVSAKDAQEAAAIFINQRPPPPSNLLSILSNAVSDEGRHQTDSANAEITGTSESFVEAFAPDASPAASEDDEDDGDFSDIQAVFDQQIDDLKKSQAAMDSGDPHRAAVIAELVRLEQLRLQLIEDEKKRLRLLAELQAARDAAERKRLQDEANRLQQEKERQLREEREKQVLMEKLRRIGKCSAGFAWRQISGGWVCEGGSHRVTDAQLQ